MRQLPIQFTVIGEIANRQSFSRLSNVVVTQKYPAGSGASVVALGQYHCALFLSVWPETFSYTLSEILAAGVFPIALDIGAISERLTKLNWGHLIPFDASVAAINDALVEVSSLRKPPPGGMMVGHQYADFIPDYYGINKRTAH